MDDLQITLSMIDSVSDICILEAPATFSVLHFIRSCQCRTCRAMSHADELVAHYFIYASEIPLVTESTCDLRTTTWFCRGLAMSALTNQRAEHYHRGTSISECRLLSREPQNLWSFMLTMLSVESWVSISPERLATNASLR